MKRREFGEPIPKYIIEADNLVWLLEVGHRYNFAQMESDDACEYFFRALVETGDVEDMSFKDLIETVETMTFRRLAERDLNCYEEYEEEPNEALDR